MADLNEIRRLRAVCEECGLEGREILDKYTDEELAALFKNIVDVKLDKQTQQRKEKKK